MTFSIWRSLFIPLLTLGLVASTAINVESAGAATPNAPTGVTATYLSASSATVSWTAPSPVSGVTITGYVVTSSPGSLTCALAASASTLSCLELGLTAGTSYTFSVAAWSAGGTGPSASSSAATSPSLSTTTTTLVASQISSGNLGSTVTLTAYVPLGATGTVNFKSGGSGISGCGSEVVTSGFATCTTKSLATGSDSLTAVYSGDSNYQSSTSSVLNFTVSSTALLEPTSPLVVASTASPINTALGLVVTGGSGTGALSFTVSNGTATGCSITGIDLSVPTNVSGTCLVTATQASDGTYLSQSSNVTTVNFYWYYATWPYSYYYCNGGDTLTGSTCTHSVNDGVEPTENVAYCNAGWYGPLNSFAPTQCYRYASITHAACTADGGTWLGSDCELYTTAPYNVTPYCPWYEQASGGYCYTVSTYSAYVGAGYSCPNGGTLSGLTCSISGGSGPNLRSELGVGPSVTRVKLKKTRETGSSHTQEHDRHLSPNRHQSLKESA